MVWTILKWVITAIILSLIALWLWQGGYWKIAEYAQVIPSPLETNSLSDLTLPGQPQFWEVPDTTTGETDHEYGNVRIITDDTETVRDEGRYGIPETQRSSYYGSVRIDPGAVESDDSNTEYLIVTSLHTAPLEISGWSLRSAFSGERRVIPLAASPFVQGVVNRVQPIVLLPGGVAYITSGFSPVGVSFQESLCTGYLTNSQTFSPPLANTCPRPDVVVPSNFENESRYGTECLDYIARLPQCSPPQLVPASLSAACRSLLSNAFSYAGCTIQNNTNPPSGSWRSYLGSSAALWLNTRDTIQLLDAQNAIVATLRY
jgi:hypothetical protein